MAMEKGRKCRALQDFTLVLREGEADAYRVRGTAVVFDTPTCLYEIDGVKYYEVIDRKVFDGCDLSNVIMNYNHGGKTSRRAEKQNVVAAHHGTRPCGAVLHCGRTPSYFCNDYNHREVLHGLRKAACLSA